VGDISYRKHSDKLFLIVYDRASAYLVLSQHHQSIVHIAILAAGDHALARDIPNTLPSRVLVLGYAGRDDLPVRYDPLDRVLVQDDHRPHVGVLHLFSRVGHRCVRADGDHVLRHDIPDFQKRLLHIILVKYPM
jgi:hypothetical protein